MSDQLEMARQSYAVAYVTAVCATTVLYDYCITVGEEIRRMWPTRLSVPKVLFFLNRYVVLPMLVCTCLGTVDITQINKKPTTYSQLRILLTVAGRFSVITVTNFVVEGILLSRVIALYRDNIPVMTVASFLYVGGIITLVGLTIKDYVGEEVLIVQDFSALPGCYAASVPSIIAGYWIAPTIIESTLFVLVVWRVIVWSRDNMGVPPALILMARDSTVYFAVVFALLFVNLFVFEYAPPFLSSLFVTPVNTAGCIAGSRMLLNLRSLAYTDTGVNDTEVEMARLSGLRFSPRRFLKRGKGPETSTMTTGIEPSDYFRTTQVTTQLDEEELEKKDAKAKPTVISFALPTITETSASGSDAV
ncbi:hypothetical protein ACEPAF_4262 [Sanghuangporus sanghuang]